MQQPEIVALIHFCSLHSIELAFIETLSDIGLIEIVEENQECFLRQDQLFLIERCLRLHLDLNINFDAIEVVWQLSELVTELKTENKQLREKLSLYES